LYDWVLGRNKDSLRLVVLFGAAARDAFGAYLMAKGVSVPTKFSEANAVERVRGASSVLSMAQYGGYDLSRVSLAGVSVPGGVLGEVYLVELPHHTHLRGLEGKDSDELRKRFQRQVDRLRVLGFKGAEGSDYSKEKSYTYERDSMPRESLSSFFDFGVPRNRYGFKWVVSRGSLSGSLVLGLAKKDLPLSAFPLLGLKLDDGGARELVRGWDRGPSRDWGEVFSSNLSEGLFERGQEGSPRLAVDETIGFFGHYRGDLESPRVVVLADPVGFDDMLTSRALTGVRGQYLQGLMESLGLGSDYLVLKTVPAAMDGVSDSDWEWVLERLQPYLAGILEKAFRDFPDAVWIADGPWAARELSKRGVSAVLLPRSSDFLSDMRTGQEQLTGDFKGVGEISPRPVPRVHLPFFARDWEGRSGDTVFPLEGDDRFSSFVAVVPRWVLEEQRGLKGSEQVEVWRLIYEDVVKSQLSK